MPHSQRVLIFLSCTEGLFTSFLHPASVFIHRLYIPLFKLTLVQILKVIIMNSLYLLTGSIAILLLIYLVYALLNPEDF